jgi:uncharacterized protein with von Willebrand factor type A (vWA) domain
MGRDDAKGEASKSVRIDAGLYDVLRAHCDRNGIRFLDFVEEALESALDFHERSDLVEKNEKLLAEIRKESETIRAIGFHEGVYAAFSLFRGKLWAVSKDELGKRTLENEPRPVRGPQMKLF